MTTQEKIPDRMREIKSDVKDNETRKFESVARTDWSLMSTNHERKDLRKHNRNIWIVHLSSLLTKYKRSDPISTRNITVQRRISPIEFEWSISWHQRSTRVWDHINDILYFLIFWCEKYHQNDLHDSISHRIFEKIGIHKMITSEEFLMVISFMIMSIWFFAYPIPKIIELHISRWNLHREKVLTHDRLFCVFLTSFIF